MTLTIWFKFTSLAARSYQNALELKATSHLVPQLLRGQITKRLVRPIPTEYLICLLKYIIEVIQAVVRNENEVNWVGGLWQQLHYSDDQTTSKPKTHCLVFHIQVYNFPSNTHHFKDSNESNKGYESKYYDYYLEITKNEGMLTITDACDSLTTPHNGEQIAFHQHYMTCCSKLSGTIFGNIIT